MAAELARTAATQAGDDYIDEAHHLVDAQTFDRIVAAMAAGGEPVDIDLAGHVTREMNGWERMWAAIAAKYGDVACEEDGEAWQYMCTHHGEHQFRHRSYKGERVYELVPARADDFKTAGETQAA